MQDTRTTAIHTEIIKPITDMMAQLLFEQGRPMSCGFAPDVGDRMAAYRLTELLAGQGRADEAIEAAGEPGARAHLARNCEVAGADAQGNTTPLRTPTSSSVQPDGAQEPHRDQRHCIVPWARSSGGASGHEGRPAAADRPAPVNSRQNLGSKPRADPSDTGVKRPSR